MPEKHFIPLYMDFIENYCCFYFLNYERRNKTNEKNVIVHLLYYDNDYDNNNNNINLYNNNANVCLCVCVCVCVCVYETFRRVG